MAELYDPYEWPSKLKIFKVIDIEREGNVEQKQEQPRHGKALAKHLEGGAFGIDELRPENAEAKNGDHGIDGRQQGIAEGLEQAAQAGIRTGDAVKLQDVPHSCFCSHDRRFLGDEQRD